MDNRSSNFDDIVGMHQKFKFANGGPPRLLDTNRASWRSKFMREELDEYVEACTQGDLALAADALIDLVVVAMGTAVEMGLPWELLWADVQRANMSKELGVSKRGESAGGDLIKPDGWQPPGTHHVLESFREYRRLNQLDDVELNPLPEVFYNALGLLDRTVRLKYGGTAYVRAHLGNVLHVDTGGKGGMQQVIMLDDVEGLP